MLVLPAVLPCFPSQDKGFWDVKMKVSVPKIGFFLADLSPRAAGRRRPALRLRSLPERELAAGDFFFGKFIKNHHFLYRNHHLKRITSTNSENRGCNPTYMYVAQQIYPTYICQMSPNIYKYSPTYMPNTYTHVTQHIYGNISVPYICWTTLLDDILGPIYLLGNTIYMLGNTVPQHIYICSPTYI